jgi:hypothetical protein
MPAYNNGADLDEILWIVYGRGCSGKRLTLLVIEVEVVIQKYVDRI